MKQTNADENDKNVGQKPACKICERITEANKDIFWVFARTHQPEDKDEFCRVQSRFCPACGREIEKLREVTLEVMPGEGLADRLCELAGVRMKTDDELGDGEIVEKLREMYEADA